MKREDIRRKMSAILMHTDEENPKECFVKIGEDEAVGLSSLLLPTVMSVFQVPGEGIICFNIEGCKEPIEFDEMKTSDLMTILTCLEEDCLCMQG